MKHGKFRVGDTIKVNGRTYLSDLTGKILVLGEWSKFGFIAREGSDTYPCSWRPKWDDDAILIESAHNCQWCHGTRVYQPFARLPEPCQECKQ